MTNAVNAGTSYTELAAYKSVSTLDSTASFMGYYNNVLWIGTFRQATSTMKGYQINNKATLPSLSPWMYQAKLRESRLTQQVR